MINARNAGCVAMLCCLAMAAGCADTVQAPASPRIDPLTGAYPRQVAMEGLHEILAVEPAIVDRSTPERPMRVTVPARLIHNRTTDIQYRFIFLGADGRPLRAPESWRYVRMEPTVQVFLEGNALHTAATDWRLEIRPAR